MTQSPLGLLFIGYGGFEWVGDVSVSSLVISLVVFLGVTTVSYVVCMSVVAGFFFDAAKSPGRSKATVLLFGTCSLLFDTFFERVIFSSLVDLFDVFEGLVKEEAVRKNAEKFL